MQVLGAQVLCCEHSTVGQVVARGFNLGEGLRVGEQLEGVLKCFEVARAEDDSGRSAVTSEYDYHGMAVPGTTSLARRGNR